MIKVLAHHGIEPVVHSTVTVYKRADIEGAAFEALLVKLNKSRSPYTRKTLRRYRYGFNTQRYVDSRQAAEILGVSVEELDELVENKVLRFTMRAVPDTSEKDRFFYVGHLKALKEADFDITKVVSTSTAMAILKRSKTNVHKLIVQGDLKLVRLHDNGRRYVFKNSVQKFLDRSAP